MTRQRLAALVGVASIVVFGAGVWWIRNRERRPYGPRWIVEGLPRPTLSRRRLLDLLAPAPGERVLEIGPGYGYYSLAVARRLGTGGELSLVDIRPPLLDETIRRASRQGLDNVVALTADATELPFGDSEFSAAYLVACLGEVADGRSVLRELTRVLRPDGRLVVGETIADPHRVEPEVLARWAQEAGLECDARVGRTSYFACFRHRAAKPA